MDSDEQYLNKYIWHYQEVDSFNRELAHEHPFGSNPIVWICRETSSSSANAPYIINYSFSCEVSTVWAGKKGQRCEERTVAMKSPNEYAK